MVPEKKWPFFEQFPNSEELCLKYIYFFIPIFWTLQNDPLDRLGNLYIIPILDVFKFKLVIDKLIFFACRDVRYFEFKLIFKNSVSFFLFFFIILSELFINLRFKLD